MPATRTRAVRQRAKGPIDPSVGNRVRALREARHLTQADLAGRDFTKGFISLLETGRTRMSVRAAEIIATRLNVSVGDLLERPAVGEQAHELQLLQAETLMTRRRTAEALALAEGLHGKVSGRLAAAVTRLRGRALAQSRRTREGLRLLDEALRAFRAVGDRELVARTLFDLALAHARLEEQGEALHLALQAESLVNEGAVVDRTFELEVLSFLAGTLVALGDFGAADLRTERARALAEDVADPKATANLYENLAVTRQRQGDLDAALAYARRSLTAYEQIGTQANVGSAWNSLGWVYLKRGQLTKASEALARAERISAEIDDPRLLAYVTQNRAELELSRGHAERAIELAEESIATKNASGRGVALSKLVLAQALAKSKASDARVEAAFRDAISALEPHGRRLAARAYQAQFEALLERGRTKPATEAARKALELLQPALG